MKISTTISLEKDDIDVLRDFCAKTGFPMSKLFQDYVSVMVKTIKLVGADRRVKVTKLDLIRIFGKGISATP
jgi:hypothetical protein